MLQEITPPKTETIVAVATPPAQARSASCASAARAPRDISCALLSSLSDNLPPRRATFVRAIDQQGLIDQVVAVHFPGPNSATGEDVVEISAHGSPYILARLLKAALAAGATAARPGEFTQRAFLNGRLDLAQAEAVCELIRARTDGAHRAALAQLEGGLSQELTLARGPILELLVRVEALLDHPEEDIPGFKDGELSSLLAELARPLQLLAKSHARGRLLSEGPRVCLVGRPNAGKSSLLNALLGAERAIVCPEPGTTRDTLEEACDVRGLPAVLVDTAGMRDHATAAAERSGMERAERALRGSDLALLVIDASREEDEEDRRVHGRILEAARREGRAVISVYNKTDLRAASVSPPEGSAWVSALRRTGLEDLLTSISARLAPEEGGGAVVTSARHQDCLRRALACLDDAEQAVARHGAVAEDRLASHLRQALAALDEIGGAAAPDEVLAAIFSKFCVGK